jgi:ABC-type lipoprotein release transport system permease subunit
MSTPALYGAPFQAYFGSDGTPESQALVNGPLLKSLVDDPAIEQITQGTFVEVDVNGTHVRTVAMTPVRGAPLLTALDGHLPRGDRDIMLGVATMHDTGTRVGETVRVSVVDPDGRPHVASFHVTGRASLNAGASGLVNFGESVNFPLLFAIALTVFGATTLLHLLLVSVGSRRVEAGLLKVLGFVRRQVAATVCWQATVVALAGIVVGAPAGIAVGRVLWRVFATNFGVVPVAVVEPVLAVILVAGVLAGANLLAAAPAPLAARSRPAQLLRAE